MRFSREHFTAKYSGNSKKDDHQNMILTKIVITNFREENTKIDIDVLQYNFQDERSLRKA